MLYYPTAVECRPTPLKMYGELTVDCGGISHCPYSTAPEGMNFAGIYFQVMFFIK